MSDNGDKPIVVVEGRAGDIADLLVKVDQWYDQEVLSKQVRAYLSAQRVVMWGRGWDLVGNVDGAVEWLMGEMRELARFLEEQKQEVGGRDE